METKVGLWSGRGCERKGKGNWKRGNMVKEMKKKMGKPEKVGIREVGEEGCCGYGGRGGEETVVTRWLW